MMRTDTYQWLWGEGHPLFLDATTVCEMGSVHRTNFVGLGNPHCRARTPSVVEGGKGMVTKAEKNGPRP